MTSIQSKICPGESATFRFGTTDVETGEAFQIMECDTSGIFFTHPQPPDLNRYYPEDYRGFHPLVEKVFRKMYGKYAAAVIRKVGASGRLLEVGCGAGWMLEAFAQRGWEVAGLERTSSIAQEITERTGIKVYTGDLALIQTEERFDVILLYNVLEHLPDPGAVIDHCKRLLNPGGRIIITLPNILSWQARLTKGSWFHLDAPRHLFHFSEASMGRFLNSHGLEITSFRNTSLALDIFGWVQSVQNLLLPKTNQLHVLMSQNSVLKAIVNVWGIPVGILTAIMLPPAVLAALASFPFRRSAIMEVWAGLDA